MIPRTDKATRARMMNITFLKESISSIKSPEVITIEGNGKIVYIHSNDDIRLIRFLKKIAEWYILLKYRRINY